MSKIQKSSYPKINYFDFFLDFLSFFWCYPKVGSLFVLENSDPKIIIVVQINKVLNFFTRFFVNSEPKILSIFC